MPTFNKKKASTEELLEQKDQHPRKGADLLLSLSAPPKAAIAEGKPVITPQDAVTGRGHSFSMPSGFPVGVATAGANHRLYHSPIKVNAAPNRGPPVGDPSAFPAWSPTYDGMVPVYQASFGKTPSTNAFVKETAAGAKRQVSDVSSEDLESKRPKQAENQKDSTGKNRIISPSSSNERSEDDAAASTTTDPRNTRYTPSAYWQQQPGYYPPPPFAGFPPTFPHWGIYGAPPSHPGMYPPYMSHPELPKPPQPSQETADSNGSDLQQVGSGCTRCIPLKHPLPTRFWGNAEVMSECKLPDFSRLVNFPDYLARGRKGEAQSVDGKKHCVMCGKLRICSASTLFRNKKDEETTHIIPKQNKGVCTACDVAVWHVTEQNYEIKWCKGCKNFRPWVAFGEKGLATKCARCRQRQKEKYATQKYENRLSEEKKEDDTLAAGGLRRAGSSA